MKQIITSLLENDMYKFSMGQAIYFLFPDYKTTWTFKCRNKNVRFTAEMVKDIKVNTKITKKGKIKITNLGNEIITKNC